MRAVLLTKHGGPEVLRVGEVSDPTAGPDEVVVDIHAASINAADYKVRLGGHGHNLKLPHILGRDFSGVVSALGPGVTDFAVGDAVFGVTDQGIEGCYAEKIAIKAAIIAKKPDQLGHPEAAAMGLTSLTSSPSTSAPRWSRPPAPAITTMSAASGRTAQSTTTLRISLLQCTIAMSYSTRSAARSKSGLTPC